MSKTLSVLLIVVSLLSGYDAEVKKDNVSLSINGNVKDFEAGKHFTLKSGDSICFKDGNGSVVISGEDYKISLNKYISVCKVMPEEDNTPVTSVMQGVLALFQVTKEQRVKGISRKAVYQTSFKKDITIDKDTKNLFIQNNHWGLPVTLKIYDKNHKVVISDINEENIYTSFLIPAKLLKDGYKIEVRDGFDEVVVESTIKINN